MPKINPISVNVVKAFADGKYENKTPFPDRPKQPIQPDFFKMAADVKDLNDADALSLKHKAYEKAVKDYTEAVRDYEAARALYNNEQKRIEEQFRKDCEADFFGVATGNIVKKKKDIVWSKAWEHGHSDGFGSVRYWYEEFAEVANCGSTLSDC